MSRFRSFIHRHLVADDPAPGYSRLDRYGGLGQTAAGGTAPDSGASPGEANPGPADRSVAEAEAAALASIEERLTAEENAGGAAGQSIRDRRYLLALVALQRAQLERVEELAAYLDSRTPGDKHYAWLLRAALTPPEDETGFKTPGT